MSRLACLVVPDFPIASFCRAEPDLCGRPLVLIDQPGDRAMVVAASSAARGLGVLAGRHSVSQARTRVANLVVRQRSESVERSAAQALFDVAASLAHRIEPLAPGRLFLDASGANRLVASERGLVTALVVRADAIGLSARAGIASNKTVAGLAARYGDGTEVVPAGMERGFLAPHPIACLDPDPRSAAAFARWGVHRLGDLARLPVDEVGTRLGAAGVSLARRARGEDDEPLYPVTAMAEVEESIDFDHSIEAVEPLLFVVRGLLERAVGRLDLSGIGASRLRLLLRRDDRGVDARTLPSLAPTRDVKTLLSLVRTDLEIRLPDAGISGVVVALTPTALQPVQLGLFAPAGPPPERLATTLARLSALCGSGRVGTPVPVDAHCPGRVDVAAFVPDPGRSIANPSLASDPSPLLVRVLRPPQCVEVFAERGAPAFVRGNGLGGRVVGSAGPWRQSGEWWTDAPFSRDYYDLQLSDGGLYRCFLDVRTRRWFLDGIYD